MSDRDDPRHISYDYTAAYRLEHLVRDLGGWRPPWGTWTVTQYVPALLILPTALLTWDRWMPWAWDIGGLVGTALAALTLLAALPFLLGLAVGHVRFDGRSPARAVTATLTGLASHLAHRATPPTRISVRGRMATVTTLPSPPTEDRP